jgi:hypothetical protein
MAMVTGLCLLLYSLGQRSLRQALNKAQQEEIDAEILEKKAARIN